MKGFGIVPHFDLQLVSGLPVASMLPNLTPKPLSLHVCTNLFNIDALNPLNIMAIAIKTHFDETCL